MFTSRLRGIELLEQKALLTTLFDSPLAGITAWERPGGDDAKPPSASHRKWPSFRARWRGGDAQTSLICPGWQGGTRQTSFLALAPGALVQERSG